MARMSALLLHSLLRRGEGGKRKRGASRTELPAAAALRGVCNRFYHSVDSISDNTLLLEGPALVL